MSAAVSTNSDIGLQSIMGGERLVHVHTLQDAWLK